MAFLPFSSGTTGLPKGVMLSHNNIAVNCEQIGVRIGESPIVLPTTNEYQEVSPTVLPLFHIYGFTVLMMSKLSLGVKVVTLPEFKPGTFLSTIKNHKATLLHVVPPICKFNFRHNLKLNFGYETNFHFPLFFFCSNLFGPSRWRQSTRSLDSEMCYVRCGTTWCPRCRTIFQKVRIRFCNDEIQHFF